MGDDEYIARHVAPRIKRTMEYMRVVALTGPRQSGKSTLCQKIAEERGMGYVTLDAEEAREWAHRDPEDFIKNLQKDGGVIDEIQRAPGLMLALKKQVDEDRRPGRFLITGSIDIIRSQMMPDNLAGRIGKLELYPFSQRELAGLVTSSDFLSLSFKENLGPQHNLWVRPPIF